MKNIHIITGGSSGIGLECAKKFKDGVVLITGRNVEKLKSAEKELKETGIDVVYKSSDISDRSSIKELFSYAKTLGRLKTVLNSAGVSSGSANAKLIFQIDLLGTENLIKETLDVVEKNTALILISSMMGHVVPSNPDYNQYLENPSEKGAIDDLVKIVKNDADTAYNFSKKGVQELVKKYAFEFGSKGARIVSISPGIIMTPMGEKAAKDHPEQMNFMKKMTPIGRNGKPEDIANAVSFLADDRASFITGIDLLIDGGLTIKLPEIMKMQEDQEK
ncbi:MAG: SDR family oxidoreductase [Tissierella sp.]|uniref:SDR family oxidoreductase n=1 Tax=Tissierella sp. TaxID=41274 RepID=UPI003F98D3CD